MSNRVHVLPTLRLPRTLLWGLLFGVIAVVIFGLWFYCFEYNAIRRTVLAELKTITEMKNNELMLWRKLGISAAEQARTNFFAQQAINEYFRSPAPENVRTLTAYLGTICPTLRSSDPILFNASGYALLPDSHMGERLPQGASAAVKQSFASHFSVISDFSLYRSPDDRLYSVIPYFQSGCDSPAAAIVFALDPGREFERIFCHWPESVGLSPKVYFVRLDAGMCHRYAYDGRSILYSVTPSLSDPENPCAECFPVTIGGGAAGGECTDADGQQILAAVCADRAEDGEWRLVVTVPISQLNQKLLPIRWGIAAGVLLMILIGLAVAYTTGLRMEKQYVAAVLDQKNRLLAVTQHYEMLVREANDIILLLNPERFVMEVNGRAEAVFGYALESFLRMRFEQLFAPEELSRLLAYLDEVRGGSTRLLESNGKRIDGSRFPVEINARILMINDLPFLQVIARDISERKNVEQALRQSEENFRVTLFSITEAVISTDGAGTVLIMNESAERLLGMTLQECRGRLLSDLLTFSHPATHDLIESPVLQCIRTRERLTFAADEVQTTAVGRDIQATLALAPLLSQQKLIGVVLVLRDVSREQKLEERLRHAQKMDAIGQLAGGIAHDFNNMLTSILGGCELLSAAVSDDPKIQKYITMVTGAAARAEILTKKLLAFARKSTHAQRSVSMTEILNGVIKGLEVNLDHSIHLETHFFSKDLIVSGDPSGLESALINIAVNACDAMPNGGNLSFSTRVTALDVNALRGVSGSVEPGAYAEISIANNGERIPPEILPRIFEPFFTTKSVGRGAGLGLCASYNIIREHRGLIVPSSEMEQTVFKVYLPLLSTRDYDSEEGVHSDFSRGHGCILVIDDEPVVRTIAVEILSAAGYEVLTAEDGLAGVEMYTRHREKVDLILLDMIMPRCDGAEAFAKLKELNPDVRVVIASGYDRTASIESLLQAGAVAFLSKPYRISTLTQTVEQALAKS